MKRSVVYKAKAGNSQPSSFNLISPVDDAEEKTVLIFDWQDSTDPDGDEITYNLIIAKDSSFNDNVYKKEEITISTALIDKTVGLEDLATYYWKVEAVDPFGAKRTSNQVWSFTTNNTNVFPGFITGKVYNGQDFTPIDGATVSIDLVAGSVTTFDGGTFIILVPAGVVTMSCAHSGYQTTSMSGVKVQEGDVTDLNIVMMPGVTSKAMPWIPLLLLGD